MPPARLRAYPPETVVAEKFQAVVAFGMLNSRMKDFFDLWAISATFPFEGIVLSGAIRATFDRRATALPADTPIALTNAFAEDAGKQAQWQAFLHRTAIALAPEPLPDLLGRISDFVLPPTRTLIRAEGFAMQWQPTSAGGERYRHLRWYCKTRSRVFHGVPAFRPDALYLALPCGDVSTEPIRRSLPIRVTITDATRGKRP